MYVNELYFAYAYANLHVGLDSVCMCVCVCVCVRDCAGGGGKFRCMSCILCMYVYACMYMSARVHEHMSLVKGLNL